MSTDSSISKPRTPLIHRKRSSSRSRISKTEQRPRSNSKSRKTTNTEPRKTKTTKLNSKERSKSRNKVIEITNKNVEKREVKSSDKEKPSVEPTRMVLRKRPLPKDNGIETIRPITPTQPLKENSKSSNESIIFLIVLTLVVFNGYDTQKYINQFQVKIIRFLESQKKKISS